MTTYDRNKYLKYRETILPKQRLANKARRDDPAKKDMDSKSQKKIYKLYPEKSLYRQAKYRAKIKGIIFNLKISDIKIPEYCPYLHIKLVPGTYSDRKVGASPTIDRIDSSIGYIPSNIEIISDLANRMKSNANKEQLITFAKSVLFLYDKS